MIEDMEKKYPRIYFRHKRKTIANEEGSIEHDGDCGLYDIFLQICTCGLHHDLLPVHGDDLDKIYPKYFDEQRGQDMIKTLLQTKDESGLWMKCCECDGAGGKAMMECEVCNGKGVVPFELPEPLSDKEVKDILKKGGWKVE